MKHVYLFEEGSRDMKDLLGGKGANLAEMTKIGIPVPPGFTITTEVCKIFCDEGNYPSAFADQLGLKIRELEEKMGKKLGDASDPLLVSVRSGAAVSMPGMMDTVLNLGLNDETVKGLAEKSGSHRFALDCYRRFIQMFGDVVMEVSHDKFEEALTAKKKEAGVESDTDLNANDLKELVEEFKEIILDNKGVSFPTNPLEQLKYSIEAVFKSWGNPRAVTYRKLNGIVGLPGTAVNVQAMVFGNMGLESGTGVAFTRDPSTGEKEFFGEFLMNAQGEDVVAGTRTPNPISELKTERPHIYNELFEFQEKLEKHYKDMQDLEFTIEDGKLWLLQTRNGKRTTQSAVKIACDMYDEGLITKEEALMMVDANQLGQLLHPQISPNANADSVARGLPASPGAASGRVVFTADDAHEWASRDEKVILVRKETSPEDIHGMYAASGILTSQGGMTSHAAVVCRGMGKCCVAGASDIMVNAKGKKIVIGDTVINEGDVITLNGTKGEVYLGEVATVEPKVSGDFGRLMEWADQVRKMEVRTNADAPEDCKVALKFGAEGIGLCRTEHMFFDEERIHIVRKMILSKDDEVRAKALAELMPFQRDDFVGIFKVMEARPVVVRLLDPPLHEFLPEDAGIISRLAEELGYKVGEIKAIISNLHEVNPMLGHRGCRLGITYPDIYEMQVEAICEAAISVSRDCEFDVNVEIEIPLVSEANELKILRKVVEEKISEFGNRINFNYKIGTMIELPRACLTADQIARHADFFSFGTNDLTQTTYGISRDDLGKFIPSYIDKGVFQADPMEGIDLDGVGKLMKICVELARKDDPSFEIGICGEQGGESNSVKFCKKIGLNYVSCSPYRIPVARLAAAQAEIVNA
ncbi:pyruvate, phosphate dikinase [Candidatus Peregrinibacteria bacterium]|jgi:pyruvate, orthophosphate dikinase|nr:pyruvate, phosphate dikinase [Candidatus Peregrinibacteria bacterium]MBT4147721.1 pyruvate, phosphate dikinase [Candidatus Peregrinibacteria bacterium]MBT4455734.1 pyruvate, phosphate dikinase [Candidatus Peregrinibacteria bacterium]